MGHKITIAKNIFILLLSFAIVVLAGLFLLPLLLLLLLVAFLSGGVVLYRKKEKKPLPKGTIEILPAEKPPIKATSDKDLEITIEALQHKRKKDS